MNKHYRQIWIDHHGDIPKDKDGNTYHIHHLDGDRTNNDISNLIAVTQEDHYKIHFFQRDFGAAALLSDGIDAEAPTRAVRQYDLNGYFIKEWNSLIEAQEYFNTKAINACVTHHQKSAVGYQWFASDECYDLEYVGPIERDPKGNNKSTSTKRLYRKHIESGEKFKSQKDALRFLGFDNYGWIWKKYRDKFEIITKEEYEQE